MKLNNDDIELCLLYGYPIDVGVGKLHPLKLKDIVKIGLSKYNEYLGVTTFDLDDIDLDDISLKDKITTFEFILVNCHYQKSFKDKFIEALSLFFKEPILLDEERGSFYIGEKEENKIINKKNYDEIRNMLMKQNYVKKEKEKEDYNPGNAETVKYIEQMKKRKKNAPKIKGNINLHSIISGIAWKSNDVNIFTVWNLTIYQLYDAIQRLDLIDNYEGHLKGIFAGTIDPKKLDFKKINWTKIIK